MLEDDEVPFEDQLEAINTLGRMCHQLKTIPDSMRIENCQIAPTGDTDEVYNGGFATVYQGVYRGREVAVKALRLYITSDFQECSGVRNGGSQISNGRSVLITRSLGVSQGGHRLETPTTPAHFTIHRPDPKLLPTRDGIRMDGSWEHQRVHKKERRG